MKDDKFRSNTEEGELDKYGNIDPKTYIAKAFIEIRNTDIPQGFYANKIDIINGKIMRLKTAWESPDLLFQFKGLFSKQTYDEFIRPGKIIEIKLRIIDLQKLGLI